MILAGTPFFKKSTLDKYSSPSSSSWVALRVGGKKGQKGCEANNVWNIRGLVRESRNRHAHPRRTDQGGDKNKEVLMTSRKIWTYFFGNGDEENAGYRVTDKRWDDLGVRLIRPS